MTKKTFKIFLLFIGLSIGKSYAGWYECYNFKGNIGNYPITLSIQISEGYFGEKAKKNYNLIGVYKYDRYNSPIRLEGKIDLADNSVVLYEISNRKQAAVFEFKFSEEASDGFWLNKTTNKKLPLQLKFVSKIADLNRTSEFSDVDVLQFHSLNDFYLVGSYSKVKGSDQAQMKRLKIIRKKDNSVCQIIDVSGREEQIGNLMTIIFDNISVLDVNKKILGVSRHLGKYEEPLIILYDLSTRRFEFDRYGK